MNSTSILKMLEQDIKNSEEKYRNFEDEAVYKYQTKIHAEIKKSQKQEMKSTIIICSFLTIIMALYVFLNW